MPTERTLPDLKAMGAGSDQRDLFVEISAMKTEVTRLDDRHVMCNMAMTTIAPYSASVHEVTDTVGHNHMPTPEVLTDAR